MLIKLLDINSNYLGIYSLELALLKANLLNLDLIKLSISNNIYIYKLGIYSKYIYRKNKSSKYVTKLKLKIFYLNIESEWNDILIKLNRVILLLNNKVRIRLVILNKGKYKSITNINLSIIYSKIINYLELTYKLVKTVKYIHEGCILDISKCPIN